MPSTNDTECGSRGNAALKKRTRRRIIRCCENCRASKYKCSRHPNACERCLEYQLECVYLPQDDEGWQVIDKAKRAHRKIENRIVKKAKREEELEEESEDGSDMEPSPLIATDAAYEDDDDIEDNGALIGRFNLTKRIGSNYRPKMVEELTQMLDTNDLQRSDYDRQVFESLPRPGWLDPVAEPKILDPDLDYIAPSLFSHTLNVNQSIHKTFESQDLADKIMVHYWERVHPVARLVHRPSFQEKYDLFWCNASRGMKDTPESTRALIYATLFAGVVSMDAQSVREELGGERQQWVKTLEKVTAVSLSRAHVIRTEKPETIQAFVMYLIPMCRSIISRTLATLVASAIDLARGIALNRDGTYYGYDAVVTQVHRMIWHQLCFLDIRVCEAQNPRARIRRDEFDTQFPVNVEDSDLESSDLTREGDRSRCKFSPADLPKSRQGLLSPSLVTMESSDTWTSMTLSNARMECNEKIREIFAARQRIRQGDEPYSAYIKKMLEIIYDFQQYMENKYYPMIDDRIPIQHYTRLVIKLHCRRMHGIVLHEYHMSTPRGRMPEQLSRTLINSGLETMEISREIETSDYLSPWMWYAGALQQHSFATLVAIEVFGYPHLDYAKRAWKSLDWIFQVPSCIPHAHKGRWVLEGAVGVMKKYLKARKLRCPTLMDERLVILPSSPRTPTLSQAPAENNTRSSYQEKATDSGAQAMFVRGTTYDVVKDESTGGKVLASEIHSIKREQSFSEEDSCTPGLLDVSPDGLMDTTSSWQPVIDPDLANHHSGYPTKERLTKTSLCQRGRDAGHGRSDAPDHMIYYHPQDVYHTDTTPRPIHQRSPPSPSSSYSPRTTTTTSNDTTISQYDDCSSNSSNSSSSDLHNTSFSSHSQGLDEGPSYLLTPADYHHPTPPPPPAFTPINQHKAMPNGLQQQQQEQEQEEQHYHRTSRI